LAVRPFSSSNVCQFIVHNIIQIVGGKGVVSIFFIGRSGKEQNTRETHYKLQQNLTLIFIYVQVSKSLSKQMYTVHIW